LPASFTRDFFLAMTPLSVRAVMILRAVPAVSLPSVRLGLPTQADNQNGCLTRSLT
jgi:hypothetical protein